MSSSTNTTHIAAYAPGTDASGELRRSLELAQVLQTTLDLETLMELFSREADKTVAHDGLVYRCKDPEREVVQGRQSRHTCSYRLLVGGQDLGELEFSRSRKFAEGETAQLEYLLSTLLYPLRNALMYTNAVTTALKDPLTGVGNRAGFQATLSRDVELAKRHDTPLALMVLDIDHFKSINDQFGHFVGDCVLRDIAECIEGCMRRSDVLFRYGGEEFVILLSNTTQRGARLLAERIRETIEKLWTTYGDAAIQVTVSLGIACLGQRENGDQLFERADRALLQAKRNGRNTISEAC